MLVFLTQKGTVYKRKPKAGAPVIYAWQFGGYITPINTKWQQYYNASNAEKLNNYISKTDPTGASLLLFEEKKRGQIVPPDGRKNLLGLYFNNGEFSETATKGYVRLSKAERVILSAYSDKELEVFDHKGFFELEPTGDTLQNEIIETFKRDEYLKQLISKNSEQSIKFNYQGQFIGGGEIVKLIGGHIVHPRDTFWVRDFANAILRKLWEVGYRFTSIATLKKINSRLLSDKGKTKTGILRRRELKQVKDEIYINYTLKVIG